jgi:hypothetical protein
MTLAAFILGTVIAMVIGCAFHFWKGGGLKWLITFNLFAIIGFWIGHIIGKLLKIEFIPLGPTNLGFALISCLIVLFGGYWLSMASVESTPDKSKNKQS